MFPSISKYSLFFHIQVCTAGHCLSCTPRNAKPSGYKKSCPMPKLGNDPALVCLPQGPSCPVHLAFLYHIRHSTVHTGGVQKALGSLMESRLPILAYSRVFRKKKKIQWGGMNMEGSRHSTITIPQSNTRKWDFSKPR